MAVRSFGLRFQKFRQVSGRLLLQYHGFSWRFVVATYTLPRIKLAHYSWFKKPFINCLGWRKKQSFAFQNSITKNSLGKQTQRYLNNWNWFFWHVPLNVVESWIVFCVRTWKTLFFVAFVKLIQLFFSEKTPLESSFQKVLVNIMSMSRFNLLCLRGEKSCCQTWKWVTETLMCN